MISNRSGFEGVVDLIVNALILTSKTRQLLIRKVFVSVMITKDEQSWQGRCVILKAIVNRVGVLNEYFEAHQPHPRKSSI